METFIKCLLKCRPEIELSERNINFIVKASKLSKKLSNLMCNVLVHCTTIRKDEGRDMYRQARIFIGYDGALEGGRDQDWWFKVCESRMVETIEYWSGQVPHRVSYELSMAEPMRFPNAYVKWTVLRNIYKAKCHVEKHKNWIIIAFIALLSNFLPL